MAVTLVTAAVATCGGSSGTTTVATAKTASTAAKTVSVADTSLGKIHVDSQGRTLNLFKTDSGTTSARSGACAIASPPLLAHGTPSTGAGAGAAASLVGTTKRSDGTQQVTYNGHPLYMFVQDQNRGDVNGQGVSAFGALWYVLSSAGSQITGQP